MNDPIKAAAQLVAFKEFILRTQREDPDTERLLWAKEAGETLTILCKRYGLPVKLIYPWISPDIIDAFDLARRQFILGNAFTLLETPKTLRLCAGGEMPIDFIGCLIEVYSETKTEELYFGKVLNAKVEHRRGCLFVHTDNIERRNRKVRGLMLND